MKMTENAATLKLAKCVEIKVSTLILEKQLSEIQKIKKKNPDKILGLNIYFYAKFRKYIIKNHPEQTSSDTTCDNDIP